MASRSVALGVVVLLGTLCISRPVSAAPILGGSLIATGGDVTVTYVADFAGDVSELYLYQVGADLVFGPGSKIFQNGGSGSNNPGDILVLDATFWGIDAGEELIFALVN